MDTIDRRTILTTGALALAAAATESRPAAAQAGPKAMFPVPAVTIPIVGETDVFQVRRIYCIGRNYAAHSREMGSDPTREPPFFFQKPTDAIQNVPPGKVVDHPYPMLTKNYHHEVELIAALKSGGTNIPADKALDHVYGYALGLDMTRRDLQNMIWSVAEQISKLSEAFELKAGDIIYSGTPENVGPVVKGDLLLCKIEGLPDMSIKIV